MRGANRNKQVFWYALYSGKTLVYDDDGNETGWAVEYANPVKAKGNISPGRGEAAVMQFGVDDTIDRTIVTEERDIPVDSQSVIWIDVTPELDDDGALAVDDNGDYVTPWNYIVRRVAKGLPQFGCTQIAVGQVDVT